MDQRLEIYSVANQEEIRDLVLKELARISKRNCDEATPPLKSCIDLVARANAKTIILQKRVYDPDFMAEYSAYYSKQFAQVDRFCTRLHFFDTESEDKPVLEFIDQTAKDQYLGFVTLRPVISAPVGASILKGNSNQSFIRCADTFPVRIAGKEFEVIGTPFMQQDNAVGACAQASIWMSLRTLRKKEGDRAHDPAQITDAATRYNVIGRIKPNREGLTIGQMVEAIRAAGYSPHSFSVNHSSTEYQAVEKIHPYIESEIPVILILDHLLGGHAVVAIGHTWSNKPHGFTSIEKQLSTGLKLNFSHAVNWVPEIIIHNDNSGPYLILPLKSTVGEYALEQVVKAIPLLPADVFMSAEEAFTVGLTIISTIYESILKGGQISESELLLSSEEIALRLLLVEKRKLRKWAAESLMPIELQSLIRLMDLPKRVWVFELHLKDKYGEHGSGNINSLVGFILIDPTGDDTINSALMMYLNKNYPRFGFKSGVFSVWDDKKLLQKFEQVSDIDPLYPIRL